MPRQLNDWLDAYLTYTKHSESPSVFHYWTGVSTLAGALRRKVWLEMGYFSWTPNFFIFMVAPPAIAAKSTSANIGARLLRNVEDIRFGPSSVTWQALLDSFEDSHIGYPMTSDPMGEQLEMCALTVVASELGTFLDPNNKEMISLMNDIWDGKDIPFIRRTKGEGEKVIVNPWINVIACTTPAWIADNVNEQFASGGFASRSIFVFADAKRQLIAYPFLSLPNDQGERERELLDDLRHIAGLRGRFELDKSAIEWGTQWYEEHYKTVLAAQDTRYRGHLDRKQTHLHKLAMVISASKRDDLRLTANDLIEANKQLTVLERDIPRVFAEMNRESTASLVAEAVELVGRMGQVSRQELFRRCFVRRIGYETFDEVITSAVNAGLVDQTISGASVFLTINKQHVDEALAKIRGK